MNDFTTDRTEGDGSFEPVIVPKRKRRLDEIDQIVLSLSAGGLTTGEIAAHFEEIDGAMVQRMTPGTKLMCFRCRITHKAGPAGGVGRDGSGK